MAVRRGIASRTALLCALLIAIGLAFTSRAHAFVYWANHGSHTIGRANPDGTGTDQSFITGSSYPCGVAVDRSHIYWTNGELDGARTIGRANLDGTGVDQSFIAGVRSLCGLAVNHNHIYWADPHDIGRANLDGTAVDPHFIPNAGAPCDVAIDSRHIYWVSSRYRVLRRANLDGTHVHRTFIKTRPICGGVAVDSAHLYWTTRGPRGIARAKLNGTHIDRKFIATRGGCGLATDTNHLYWAAFFPATTIGRANLDGTGVNDSFIAGASDACGVAVDRTLSLLRVRKNRRRGTAKLTLEVSGLGRLTLARTARVHGVEVLARHDRVSLRVNARGRARKGLDRKGTAKVQAKITFSPFGGQPAALTKPLKLLKRG